MGGCTWLSGFVRPRTSESAHLVERARQAFDHGDKVQARRLLVEAAAAAPDEPELQRQIGRAFLMVGEHNKAVKHLQSVARACADDPESYLELATVLMEAGRLDECQEMVEAVLRLIPSHTEAQLLEGRLAELRHKDDEALAIYYRLLGSDPSEIEATLRIADVLAKTERTSQAAPLLRAVIESDRVSEPSQVRARWALGLVYGRDHRWTEAAENLAMAAEARSDLSADDCYHVAYAYWEAGETQKARDFVARALAIDPKHADARTLSATFSASELASQAAYSRLPPPAPRGW